MANKEKNKGGRPRRYADEKAERISGAMRPRFKQSLELVAKSRQTTLSQALEFAAAFMAHNYQIDGKPVIEYIVEKNEKLIDVVQCITVSHSSDDIMERFHETSAWLKKIETSPPSLISAEDKFVFDSLQLLSNKLNTYDLIQIDVFASFNTVYEFIVYYWRQAYTAEEIVDLLIKILSFAYDKIKVPDNFHIAAKYVELDESTLEVFDIYYHGFKHIFADAQSNNDDKSS